MLNKQHEDDDDVQEEVIENCSQHSSLHKQPCPVTIAASVNSIQLYGEGGTLNHNHLMRPPSQIHQLDGLATLSPLGITKISVINYLINELHLLMLKVLMGISKALKRSEQFSALIIPKS